MQSEKSPGRPDVRTDGAGGIVLGTRIIPGPDYRLGPGDLLEVQVATRLESTRHHVVVDLDGAINIQPIGPVEVSGLTLPDAYRRVVERARTLFRFVDVTLAIASPRSFEVVVSGEVVRPGAIVTSALRRLHEVLQTMGGVTPMGSMRRVRLTHKGVVREVDLLRFELAGDLTQNPFVEEGMAIHVPVRAASVSLTGAVRRPGDYEIGPAGTLGELLELAGGLSPAAARSESRLTRIAADGRKETFALDLGTALQPPSEVPLRPGDVLFVPTGTFLQDVVEVRGAFTGGPDSAKVTSVGKPTILQRFELAHGERVADVIRKAGGLAPYADLRLALVDRSGEGGPRQRIPVDLYRLFVEKDESQNVLLQNGDVVTVPVAEDRVFVVGEVKTVGPHEYRPELGIRDYVVLSGGPGVRAKLEAITVTFRNGKTYPVQQAPPLEPGAVVTVPEVALRWWQDYVTIARVVVDLIAAYTGLYILFGGRTATVLGSDNR